jgi:peptidoglycan/LPS O-acetylase OafA/YrhL
VSFVQTIQPLNAPLNSSIELRFLDGLRGLAALEVMVGHARWLLWEGYSTGYLKHPQTYNIFAKALVYFFSAFRYGHQAVMFFFVLSGFVIHLRYSQKIQREGPAVKFDFWRFIKRRAKRLYPPLALAMIVTLLCDALGVSRNFAIYFHATPYELINQNITMDHQWLTAIGNLLFLMKTYVPTWGTNDPLWSLKFEWWFYMFYPLFFLITRKSVLYATLLMSLLFVLSFFGAIWPLLLLRSVFSAMLFWWFGALLADIYCGRIRISFKVLCPLIAALFLLPLFPGGTVLNDLVWSIFFVGVISTCFVIQNLNPKILTPLVKLKWLGDMSYSLYVIHFPILILMSGWLMARSPDHSLPSGFLYLFAGMCLVLASAYLAHLAVERPFISRGREANLRTIKDPV